MLTEKIQASEGEKALFQAVFIPHNGLVWGINIPTIYKKYIGKSHGIMRRKKGSGCPL